LHPRRLRHRRHSGQGHHAHFQHRGHRRRTWRPRCRRDVTLGGREKNNNLDVAQRLDARLRAVGFKTVLTRQNDTFIPLDKRASISNRQNNALFVSVHFNDSPSKAVSGAEVYYKSPVSRGLAQRVLQNIDGVPGASARYVKTANFRVLRLNQNPAVLVECGYLSNRTEGARCGSAIYRERIAGAIATALMEQRGKTAPTGGPVVAAR